MGQAFDRDRGIVPPMIGGMAGTGASASPHLASGESAEMPRYKCHKEVWALKIAAIEYDADRAKADGNRETDGSADLIPADPGYAMFTVDAAYVRKHNPQVGGYYVVYKDGYKSFSPAEAFEDGYTRL